MALENTPNPIFQKTRRNFQAPNFSRTKNSKRQNSQEQKFPSARIPKNQNLQAPKFTSAKNPKRQNLQFWDWRQMFPDRRSRQIVARRQILGPTIFDMGNQYQAQCRLGESYLKRYAPPSSRSPPNLVPDSPAPEFSGAENSQLEDLRQIHRQRKTRQNIQAPKFPRTEIPRRQNCQVPNSQAPKFPSARIFQYKV